MQSGQPRRSPPPNRAAPRGGSKLVLPALAGIVALCAVGVYLDRRNPTATVASLASPTSTPTTARRVEDAPAAPTLASAPVAPPPRDAIAAALAPRPATATSQAPSPQPSASQPPAKMTPAAWRDLDAALLRAIDTCWGKPTGMAGFAPKIRIDFSRDGALSSKPTILNPPANPVAVRAAQGAANALGRCKDLTVPARFASFYDQWRTRVIHLAAGA